MREWYANLAVRERLIVAVGGVVTLLILFWALVWLPLDRGQEELRTSVGDWRQSLAELRVLAASMSLDEGDAAAAPTGDTGQSAVVVVDQTLRERNLNSAVKRRQPTPNGIRVEFEDVAFDQLVVWLGDLSATHGLSVQAGSLSQGSRAEKGRINASLTLEQSP
jgi:general secretion pathway protein M